MKNLWLYDKWNERRRPKDDGMCNFCVLPIIRFCQTQPKLIWMFPTKEEFVCFNITIAIKEKFSMETGLRCHEDNAHGDLMQVLVPHFCVLLNVSPVLLRPAYIIAQMVFNLTLHAVASNASRQLCEQTRKAAEEDMILFCKWLERCKIWSEWTVRSVLISCENRSTHPQIFHKLINQNGDSCRASLLKRVFIWHVPSARESFRRAPLQQPSKEEFSLFKTLDDSRLKSFGNWNSLRCN